MVKKIKSKELVPSWPSPLASRSTWERPLFGESMSATWHSSLKAGTQKGTGNSATFQQLQVTPGDLAEKRSRSLSGKGRGWARCAWVLCRTHHYGGVSSPSLGRDEWQGIRGQVGCLTGVPPHGGNIRNGESVFSPTPCNGVNRVDLSRSTFLPVEYHYDLLCFRFHSSHI